MIKFYFKEMLEKNKMSRYRFMFLSNWDVCDLIKYKKA